MPVPLPELLSNVFCKSGGGLVCNCVLALVLALALLPAVYGQPSIGNADALLHQADRLKTSDNQKFSVIVQHLQASEAGLSARQHEWLVYLTAWREAYEGDLQQAVAELSSLANSADDLELRFRAKCTLVSALVVLLRYEEAYSGLEQILQQMPAIRNTYNKAQGLLAAGMVYADSGQNDLALRYADMAFRSTTDTSIKCHASFISNKARYKQGTLQVSPSELEKATALCLQGRDLLFANSIRVFFIQQWLKDDAVEQAAHELDKNYKQVKNTKYWELTAQFDALRAILNWKLGRLDEAHNYAMMAIGQGSKNEHTHVLSDAYHTLYLVASKNAQWRQSLDWYIKYRDADKGYLDETSAKALAYQKVRQQVQATQAQVESGERQNRILRLQQSLTQKSAETNRLYMTLLGLLVFFLGLWTWRLAHSRRKYRCMARRDSLTGIFNRQHFLDAAGYRLAYCEHSQRNASLILIDLDHFKQINDSHGHATGDLVLKQAVQACAGQLRSIDVYGRLGGEEFGILLPECDMPAAYSCAERIRQAIELVASSDGAAGMGVTASLGVTDVRRSGYDLSRLLADADAALYSAKRAGRNQVAGSEISAA